MTRTMKLVPGFLLLALAAGAPVQAQESGDDLTGLRKEVEELKAGQVAIRRQLAEIKALIKKGGGQQQQAKKDQVADVTIDLAKAPFQGDANAPITIVEFADFQ